MSVGGIFGKVVFEVEVRVEDGTGAVVRQGEVRLEEVLLVLALPVVRQ